MLSALPQAPELDKYELEDEIGHGGMATVYRALDRRLGREVAVKLIHRHLRENAQVGARFVAEARAVARLRHPNIVEVFDVSEVDERERYLVVELVRGPNLRALLAEHGPLPPEAAAGIAVALCDALEHAHAEGVIHRDVKPENVLIALPGPRESAEPAMPRVKLTDFGIAKLLDAQGVTSTGQVLGSPAHMAPEQIEGGAVDARSDLFSLGVLLYECMSGRLPFDGKNPAQVLRAVLDGIYEPLERVRPEVGARWSAILDRALCREPSGRFATAAEFSEALRAALREVELEPLSEFARFVLTPKAYLEDFPRRIGERLVVAGGRARAQKRFGDARDLLNRALLYLPGDAEVLRHVSGLAARRRWSTAARWVLFGGLALAASLGGVLAWRAVSRTVSEPMARPAPRAAEVRGAAPRVPRPVAPAALPAASEPVAKKRRRPVVLPAASSAEASGATRLVNVRITGATGGRLRVDGVERRWFGEEQVLTLGEHLFEFVPPNDTCCVATSRIVLIKEGAGVQDVVGRIDFKPATLRVESSEGGAQMACPTMFYGDFAVPGSRSVPMSRGEVSERCTISPLNNVSAPTQKLVTLRAGQTTVVPWP